MAACLVAELGQQGTDRITQIDIRAGEDADKAARRPKLERVFQIGIGLVASAGGLRSGRRPDGERELGPNVAAGSRDRERMGVVIAERARAAAAELGADAAAEAGSDAADAAADLSAVVLEELGPVGIGALLDVGTGTGRMLEVLGRRAQHAVGVDISAPALKLARTRVHGAGLAHVEFHRGDMYRLPSSDARFDLVNLDRVLAGAERPEAALREAARTLKAGGRLLIVDAWDDFAARDGNPLLLLRRWITAAGLAAQRLLPCELESGHYLIALAARPAAQAGVAA